MGISSFHIIAIIAFNARVSTITINAFNNSDMSLSAIDYQSSFFWGAAPLSTGLVIIPDIKAIGFFCATHKQIRMAALLEAGPDKHTAPGSIHSIQNRNLVMIASRWIFSNPDPGSCLVQNIFQCRTLR